MGPGMGVVLLRKTGTKRSCRTVPSGGTRRMTGDSSITGPGEEHGIVHYSKTTVGLFFRYVVHSEDKTRPPEAGWKGFCRPRGFWASASNFRVELVRDH